MQEPQFDDLYREVIMDHYRRPRGHGELDAPDYRIEGANPLCGDEVQLDLKVEGQRLIGLAWQGAGCSISQSSASMLAEAIDGCTVDEASSLVDAFKEMMLRGGTAEGLGDLEALQGVRKFPVRVKCALLAWNVLQDALEQAAVERR
jgi:nitrogen fixation NifU-like protein